MTQKEVIAHWRKGAKESLELAKKALELESYSLALFHCQLAVEKTLKSLIIQEDKEPPPTHNLSKLASILEKSWSTEEKNMFSDLSDYAVTARYDDLEWSSNYATEVNASAWVVRTHSFMETYYE